MKKAYSKPQILFDSFELAQDIAAGCEEIANHALYQCAWYDEESDITVFVESISACTYKPQKNEQPDMYNGLCYHVPTDSYNVFTS